MLKRARKGTFHKMSRKHLHRYVNEFAGRHDIPNTPNTCLLYTSPSPRDS